MVKFLPSQTLKQYNTFGFSVKASLLVIVNTIQEFLEVLESIEWKENPHLIIGGGSNVLLKGDFEGLVVINQIKGIEKIGEDEQTVLIKAGGGENWHQFVMHTIKLNLGGMENLSLIPGTVGAAPMQNIGAYGVEIKDYFESLEAIHLQTGELEVFDAESCRFDYRESVFKHSYAGQYLIASVTFRLNKVANHKLHLDYGAIKDILSSDGILQPSIKDVSDAVIKIRQSKLPDPAKIGNSGSFFKNPIVSQEKYLQLQQEFQEIPAYDLGNEQFKLAAGWLIEQAGWKGYKENGVGVHDRQALVLVNHGSGTGAAIVELAKKIQDSILTKFGIELSPEVNFI